MVNKLAVIGLGLGAVVALAPLAAVSHPQKRPSVIFKTVSYRWP